MKEQISKKCQTLKKQTFGLTLRRSDSHVSTVFWFWEKWDRRRFTNWSWNGDKTAWNVEEEVEPFMPLSFYGSDIALVFYIWTFCCLVSVGFLAVEISWMLKWEWLWLWRRISVGLSQTFRFINFCGLLCISLILSKFKQ